MATHRRFQKCSHDKALLLISKCSISCLDVRLTSSHDDCSRNSAFYRTKSIGSMLHEFAPQTGQTISIRLERRFLVSMFAWNKSCITKASFAASLAQWKKDKRSSAWLWIPIEKAHVIPVAAELGTKFTLWHWAIRSSSLQKRLHVPQCRRENGCAQSMATTDEVIGATLRYVCTATMWLPSTLFCSRHQGTDLLGSVSAVDLFTIL